MLRKAITRYIRHAKPNLDVEKILYRTIWESGQYHTAYNQRKLCVKCPVHLETRNLLIVSHMPKIYRVYYVVKVVLSMGNITLIFHFWYSMSMESILRCMTAWSGALLLPSTFAAIPWHTRSRKGPLHALSLLASWTRYRNIWTGVRVSCGSSLSHSPHSNQDLSTSITTSSRVPHITCRSARQWSWDRVFTWPPVQLWHAIPNCLKWMKVEIIDLLIPCLGIARTQTFCTQNPDCATNCIADENRQDVVQ